MSRKPKPKPRYSLSLCLATRQNVELQSLEVVAVIHNNSRCGSLAPLRRLLKRRTRRRLVSKRVRDKKETRLAALAGAVAVTDSLYYKNTSPVKGERVSPNKEVDDLLMMLRSPVPVNPAVEQANEGGAGVLRDSQESKTSQNSDQIAAEAAAAVADAIVPQAK